MAEENISHCLPLMKRGRSPRIQRRQAKELEGDKKTATLLILNGITLHGKLFVRKGAADTEKFKAVFQLADANFSTQLEKYACAMFDTTVRENVNLDDLSVEEAHTATQFMDMLKKWESLYNPPPSEKKKSKKTAAVPTADVETEQVRRRAFIKCPCLSSPPKYADSSDPHSQVPPQHKKLSTAELADKFGVAVSNLFSG
jgi:hypothetical protein